MDHLHTLQTFGMWTFDRGGDTIPSEKYHLLNDFFESLYLQP